MFLYSLTDKKGIAGRSPGSRCCVQYCILVTTQEETRTTNDCVQSPCTTGIFKIYPKTKKKNLATTITKINKICVVKDQI